MSEPGAEASEAFSALAHELRTPLTAITGFAELIEARDDRQMHHEAAGHILESAERLSNAIELLLEAIAAGTTERYLASALPTSRRSS